MAAQKCWRPSLSAQIKASIDRSFIVDDACVNLKDLP